MTNIYPRVFKKVIKGKVGGRHLTKRGGQYFEDEFLLKGDPKKTDMDEITVEIPDAEAEKYFLKHNKFSIINGYLVEITEGYEMELNEANSVSDGFLKELLKKPVPTIKKEIAKFTSPVPVSRLLEFAEEKDMSMKTIEFLKARFEELS